MPCASLSGNNKMATLKKRITKMKLTEEKHYWNFRLRLFLAQMRLNVLGMAITQPCQILINNYSLDQFFLHGTIRTQKIIEVMMLIRTTGESVKFIGSKYIQESLINTTLTRPDYFLFLQESQAKVLTNESTHLFIYFKTKTNDRVASRLAMGLWNICCVRNTAIICWPPRRVTALQVVRTLFLCPRPRLPPLE